MAEQPIACPRCASVWATTFSRPDRIGASGRKVGKSGTLRSCAECGLFYLLKDDGSLVRCGTTGKHVIGPSNQDMDSTTDLSHVKSGATISGDPRGGTERARPSFDDDMAQLD